MKSPFAPKSHEEFMEELHERAHEYVLFSANKLEMQGIYSEYCTKESWIERTGPKVFEDYVKKHSSEYEKKEKRKKNMANRIDKLLKLGFLNDMDKRLNWANRSKTALYTTRVKALQHCIAEFEKELRKEEIE